MSNHHVIEHPILSHKLSILREKTTKPEDFRKVMKNLSALMAYEVTRDLKTSAVELETPLEKTKSLKISEDLVLVSILRAGNGMLEGLLEMLPFASVGHIGIYRDKFINNTVEYYFRLPNQVEGKKLILVDPLLATGDTACAAITRLKQYEVGPINFMCVLASEVGLNRLKDKHPDVNVYCLSVERELDSSGYILPGIGDAGDRLYATV